MTTFQTSVCFWNKKNVRNKDPLKPPLDYADVPHVPDDDVSEEILFSVMYTTNRRQPEEDTDDRLVSVILGCWFLYFLFYLFSFIAEIRELTPNDDSTLGDALSSSCERESFLGWAGLWVAFVDGQHLYDQIFAPLYYACRHGVPPELCWVFVFSMEDLFFFRVETADRVVFQHVEGSRSELLCTGAMTHFRRFWQVVRNDVI